MGCLSVGTTLFNARKPCTCMGASLKFTAWADAHVPEGAQGKLGEYTQDLKLVGASDFHDQCHVGEADESSGCKDKQHGRADLNLVCVCL